MFSDAIQQMYLFEELLEDFVSVGLRLLSVYVPTFGSGALVFAFIWESEGRKALDWILKV